MFHLFCTWITNSSTRRIEIRNNTKSGLKIWSSSWTYTTGSNPSTVKSSQVSSNLFVSLARPSRYIRERCILLRKTFVGNEKRVKKREHGMPGRRRRSGFFLFPSGWTSTCESHVPRKREIYSLYAGILDDSRWVIC